MEENVVEDAPQGILGFFIGEDILNRFGDGDAEAAGVVCARKLAPKGRTLTGAGYTCAP